MCLSWLKKLFGGKKEEQSQGDASSMPEQSAGEESDSPKSEEHEHPQQ